AWRCTSWSGGCASCSSTGSRTGPPMSERAVLADSASATGADAGPLATPLTRLVGITHPIMQDGMGPFSTVAIAIAVANAGGLGSVSVPGLFLDPAVGARTIREHIDMVLAGTSRPFAVNVPVGRD